MTDTLPRITECPHCHEELSIETPDLDALTAAVEDALLVSNDPTEIRAAVLAILRGEA